MNSLSKKRAKAILIDTAISTAVSFAVEPFLRKKVKNEFVHAVLTPTFIFWGLEYAQLRLSGQTAGQKAMAIEIRSEDGGELESEQILKRLMHRDFSSTIMYLRDRDKFDAYEGEKFPHDLYAHTVVKEVQGK